MARDDEQRGTRRTNGGRYGRPDWEHDDERRAGEFGHGREWNDQQRDDEWRRREGRERDDWSMREDRERERERERGRYESSSERGRSESSPERWRESRMVWGEGAYGGRERTREFDDERSERGSGYTRGARQRYSGGLGSGAGMGMPESSGMGYTGGSSYGGAGYAGTGYGNTGYTWSGMQGRNERNHYGRGPKGYQRSDQRIEEDVNEALYRDHDVDASEVEVKVAGGEVTLNGTVEDRAMKRHAEDCACAVPGVKNVMNQIRVSPHRSSEQGFGRTQQHEDETRNRRSTPSHKMGA